VSEARNMGGAPKLTAVVCTLNRADLLGQMLGSLCEQTLEPSWFEVVVVDDGSEDHSREVVRAFETRLPLRYSYQRNAGLASARNHGIFLSRGELLLFLDDDDVADPGLLEAHVVAHRTHPSSSIGILGHTRLAPALVADPLMHFVTEVGCFLFSYGTLEAGALLDFGHFWGGRSSCKRSFLIDNGVFNPIFRFGCEDIELAFRLSRYGFKVVYEPRAVLAMVRGVGFDDFCRRLWRQGQSNLVFSRIHDSPEVRRWTEVREAAEGWSRFGAAYDVVMHSARELDRIVRKRMDAELAIPPEERALLHRAYWAAFRASKFKGIVEKAREMGEAVGLEGSTAHRVGEGTVPATSDAAPRKDGALGLALRSGR